MLSNNDGITLKIYKYNIYITEIKMFSNNADIM